MGGAPEIVAPGWGGARREDGPAGLRRQHVVPVGEALGRRSFGGSPDGVIPELDRHGFQLLPLLPRPRRVNRPEFVGQQLETAAVPDDVVHAHGHGGPARVVGPNGGEGEADGEVAGQVVGAEVEIAQPGFGSFPVKIDGGLLQDFVGNVANRHEKVTGVVGSETGAEHLVPLQ